MIQDLNALLRNKFAARRAFLQSSGAAALAAGVGVVGSRSAGAATGTAKATNPDKASLKSGLIQIREHENAHAAFLAQTLGSSARPEPTFQNLEMPTFAKFAQMSHFLENLEVGAYLHAAPVIDSPTILAAAGSIMTIEARHSGYLNSVFHDPITGQAFDLTTDVSFDTTYPPEQVVAQADPFIASLNGGPPVTYDDTASSPENDIAILNYALALEYFGASFYNINVVKFYKDQH